MFTPISRVTIFLGSFIVIPTGLSLALYRTYPGWSYLFLSFCIGLSSIHSYFGFGSIVDWLLPKAKPAVPKPVVKAASTPIQPVQSSKPDNSIQHLPALEAQLMEILKDTQSWTTLLSHTKDNFSCTVQQKGAAFFYKIICDFESTPEETFDLLGRIDRRPEWDEICESGGTVDAISPTTSIQFMKTKGIWPSAPRDALVMSFVKKLDDGRYMNITKSIDSYEGYVPPSNSVRMLAEIAGFVVEKTEKGSRVTQVVHGDLGGWLPKSVVSMVTTQAFPVSMRRANSILKKVQEPRKVSQLIEASEGRGTAPVVTSNSTHTNSSTAIAKGSSQKVQRGTIKTILKLLKDTQPFFVYLILFIILRKRN